LGTILARTQDGVMIVNLWETMEGRLAMAQEPEVQHTVTEARLPPPDIEASEVVKYEFRPEVLED
jgi:hypothetical protein